eukprot:TRINITY_DN14768_c0_g1_i1.p1 TRINITY_DN14768_c0_g1~~TRINITY_DN14768_c0_g1_i1.p1  ORF type:complete len:562 (-),score=166.07 TRINITY_DN14768_c0_g1_i1:106-1791(-)
MAQNPVLGSLDGGAMAAAAARVKRKDIEDRSWEEQQAVVLQELRRIYAEVVEPVESTYAYETFRPSYFADRLTTSTPFVLFLGPFSAGKTTFINYMLGGDYLWTGPEPTTNKFTVVFYGNEVNQISGRILAANTNLPFRGLQQFGNEFLEGFAGYQIPSDLLRGVTLVDSPGVLETSDLHSRAYKYVDVMNWFVERSDLIFVMFDPTKLDAGRELRAMFQHALKGHESRVRIVLNKADSVGQHELMKVHGALFWNLSNMVHSSEPPRVYVSSFWNKPYQPNTNHELFESEKRALMYDMLHTVPLEALDRKVAALLKRAQDVLIHACIIGTARQKLPKYFGKQKSKCETLDNLEQTYAEVQAKFRLPAADFPKEDEYRQFFTKHDLYDFKKLTSFEEKTNAIAKLQKAISEDIPALLKTISSESAHDPRKSTLLKTMLEKQQLDKTPEPAATVPKPQAPPPPPPAAVTPPQGVGAPAMPAQDPAQLQLFQQQLLQQQLLQLQLQQAAAAQQGGGVSVDPSASLNPAMFALLQQQAWLAQQQNPQNPALQQQLLAAMAAQAPQ